MKKLLILSALLFSFVNTAHADGSTYLENDISGINFKFDSDNLVAKGNEVWRCHFDESLQGKRKYKSDFGKKGNDYPYRCDAHFVVDLVVYSDTGQIQLSGYADGQNTFNFTTEASQWTEHEGSAR